MNSEKALTKNLFLVFSLFFVGVFCSGTIMLLLEQRRSVRAALQESFQSNALALASNLALFVKIYNLHAIQRTLSDSYLAQKSEFVTIASKEGKRLLGYPANDADYSAGNCANTFSEIPIELYDERIGTLAYCVNISRFAKTTLPVELASIFFFLIFFISALYFYWLRSQTNALGRFMRAIDELNADVPHDPQVPASDRGNATVVSLYEKLSQLILRLQTAAKELSKKERDALYVDLSRQLAHDIRSPLAALNICMEDIAPQIAEERRSLLKAVALRIQNIADDLVRKTRYTSGASPSNTPSEPLQDTQLALTALLIVMEKRLQYRNSPQISIDLTSAGKSLKFFSRVREPMLRRILSNLIDNAVQAIDAKGSVTLQIQDSPGAFVMEVADTGIGIPEHILHLLAAKNMSFGKQAGSGLGLYQAKSSVQAWGGRLEILSKVGTGTQVRLFLPKIPSPDWFVPSIAFERERAICIIDDDPSIHELWRLRLATSGGARPEAIHYFLTPGEFLDWRRNQSTALPILALCDLSFPGDPYGGLDLASKLRESDKLILITNGYDDPQVLSQCSALKIGMVAKPMLPHVRLIYAQNETEPKPEETLPVSP